MLNTNFSEGLEWGRIGKLMFVMLVLFCSCNHAVRATGATYSGGTLTGFDVFDTSKILGSLNSARKKTGYAFQSKTTRHCPKFGYTYCRATIRGVAVVTGLY